MFPGSLDIFNAHVAQYLPTSDTIALSKKHFIDTFEKMWPTKSKQIIHEWTQKYVLYSLSIISESRLNGILTISEKDYTGTNGYLHDQLMKTFKVVGLQTNIHFIQHLSYPSKYIDASNVDLYFQKIYSDSSKFLVLLDYPRKITYELAEKYLKDISYHEKILQSSAFDEIIVNNFYKLVLEFLYHARFHSIVLFSKKYKCDYTNICLYLLDRKPHEFGIKLRIILEYNKVDLNIIAVYNYMIRNINCSTTLYLKSAIDLDKYNAFIVPYKLNGIKQCYDRQIVTKIKEYLNGLVVTDEIVDIIMKRDTFDYVDALVYSDLIFPRYYYEHLLNTHRTRYVVYIIGKIDMAIPESIETMIIELFNDERRDIMFNIIRLKKMTPRLREAYMSMIDQ